MTRPNLPAAGGDYVIRDGALVPASSDAWTSAVITDAPAQIDPPATAESRSRSRRVNAVSQTNEE